MIQSAFFFGYYFFYFYPPGQRPKLKCLLKRKDVKIEGLCRQGPFFLLKMS